MNEFKVHMLNEKGIEKANKIKYLFENFLTELLTMCPASREASILRTKLEEACFFAKKSMASDTENQQL